MELDFKQCSERDVDVLLVLSKNTFTQAFEKYNNPEDFKAYLSTAFTGQTLLAQLRNPNSFFYFVYLGNQAIGYMKLNQKQAQTDLISDDGMELERIYFLEEFQGRGFGASVLRKVTEVAISLQKKFIWLGVWEKNTRAIVFYERYGFKKFGTHPYYIGTDKQTDLLMRLELCES